MKLIFALTPTVNKQNNRFWNKSCLTSALRWESLSMVCHVKQEREDLWAILFYWMLNVEIFLLPKVVREDHTLYYFQQDNAGPHKGNKVQKYLKNRFGDRFIDKKIRPPQVSRLIESMWLFSMRLSKIESLQSIAKKFGWIEG